MSGGRHRRSLRKHTVPTALYPITLPIFSLVLIIKKTFCFYQSALYFNILILWLNRGRKKLLMSVFCAFPTFSDFSFIFPHADMMHITLCCNTSFWVRIFLAVKTVIIMVPSFISYKCYQCKCNAAHFLIKVWEP